MNTIFTVTVGAKTDNEKAYTVNIGQNILEGISDIDIRAKASQSLVIDVQGKMRKVKTGEVDMEIALQKVFPNATVEEGVVKTVSTNTQLKNAVAKYGIDKVNEALAKMGIDQD